jgi:hypothetical protein
MDAALPDFLGSLTPKVEKKPSVGLKTGTAGCPNLYSSLAYTTS